MHKRNLLSGHIEALAKSLFRSPPQLQSAASPEAMPSESGPRTWSYKKSCHFHPIRDNSDGSFLYKWGLLRLSACVRVQLLPYPFLFLPASLPWRQSLITILCFKWHFCPSLEDSACDGIMHDLLEMRSSNLNNRDGGINYGFSIEWDIVQSVKM